MFARFLFTFFFINAVPRGSARAHVGVDMRGCKPLGGRGGGSMRLYISAQSKPKATELDIIVVCCATGRALVVGGTSPEPPTPSTTPKPTTSTFSTTPHDLFHNPTLTNSTASVRKQQLLQHEFVSCDISIRQVVHPAVRSQIRAGSV